MDLLNPGVAEQLSPYGIRERSYHITSSMPRRWSCLQVFWWVAVAFALYVVISNYLQSPIDFTKQTLYADSHDVIEVTTAPQLSFEVSQNPRVVVFYSPYCVSS